MVNVYSCLQLASPLWELTCHTGSHSVTCHPAEVTFPPLPQSVKAGTQFSDFSTSYLLLLLRANISVCVCTLESPHFERWISILSYPQARVKASCIGMLIDVQYNLAVCCLQCDVLGCISKARYHHICVKVPLNPNQPYDDRIYSRLPREFSVTFSSHWLSGSDTHLWTLRCRVCKLPRLRCQYSVAQW